MLSTTTNGIVPTIDIGGNNDNGWGNGGAWIWLIVILAVLFRWNNGNNGGNGGNGESILPLIMAMNSGSSYTDSAVQSGFDNLAVSNKLDAINGSVTDGFFGQNTATLQGFGNLNTSLCSSFDAVNSNITNLGFQLQNSLLQVSNAMDAIKYENAQNTAQIVQANADGVQRVVDLVNANTMQDLRDQLTSARGELSQAQQTQDIVGALQTKAPIPAYITASPYQQQMYGCSGCGCNGNNF